MMALQSGTDPMISHPLSSVYGYKKCSIADCDGNAHHAAKGARGWCGAHYQRWRKHGDPLSGGARRGVVEKFIQAVISGEMASDDCITWPYSRNASGYGVGQLRGERMLAHRAVCILAHGEAPGPRFQAAHNCGKGHEGCVNPRHLRWATKAQNQADRIHHGTDNRGVRHGNSKLTEDQVQQIRSLSGRFTKQEISDKFGVSRECISAILSGKTWRHLIEGGERRLQSAQSGMVSHQLSSVYGQYVIEFDGEAQFCTADPRILFENLEGVEYKDCDKVRVILLSSEDWSRDDITDLVWEAMAEHYADGPGVALPATVEEWDEIYGYNIGFIRWGIENEFDATAERARRQAAFEARQARFSKFRDEVLRAPSAA